MAKESRLSNAPQSYYAPIIGHPSRGAIYGMIQRLTRLAVADNSGARVAQCIGLFGRPHRIAGIGRLIKVSIKDVHAGTAARERQAKRTGPAVRPGQVHNALVVRSRQGLARADGRAVRFDDNAVVLLAPDFRPLGTRVTGPVPQELKQGNWLKILTLSSRIV